MNNINAYQEILQTKSSSFFQPQATREISKTVIGDGLPFAEGANHKRRRALVNSKRALSIDVDAGMGN